MSYEQDLIDKFTTEYKLKRLKLRRQNKIKCDEDILKFTKRFTASWDAQYLTRFSEHMIKEDTGNGTFIIRLQLEGKEGQVLRV